MDQHPPTAAIATPTRRRSRRSAADTAAAPTPQDCPLAKGAKRAELPLDYMVVDNQKSGDE